VKRSSRYTSAIAISGKSLPTSSIRSLPVYRTKGGEHRRAAGRLNRPNKINPPRSQPSEPSWLRTTAPTRVGILFRSKSGPHLPGDVLNVTYRYRSVFVPDWIAFDGVIIPRSEPDGEHEVSFEQKRTEATKLRCLRSLLFKTYFRVTDVSLLGEPQGRCSPEQNRTANLDEHSSVPVLFQDCR